MLKNNLSEHQSFVADYPTLKESIYFYFYSLEEKN